MKMLSRPTLQRVSLVVCVIGVMILVDVHFDVISRLTWSLGESLGDLGLGWEGRPTHYVTFGCSVPSNNIYHYAFYLPLSVLAWERIGFHSIVVLTGNQSQWASNPMLGVIQRSLAERKATVIHLEALTNNEVMLSQVSRIFATGLHNLSDSNYLVTSDADLWPLDKNFHLLPPTKKILATNTQCCGYFDHRNITYQMVAMASVGATVGTWREVMTRDGKLPLPNGTDGILHYMEEEFGPVVRDPVTKGPTLGWSLDQRTLSMRLEQWGVNHGKLNVQFNKFPRGARVNRGRSWSTYDHDMVGKVDAHLLISGFSPLNWVKLRGLLRYMYGEGSAEYEWCEAYRMAFMKAGPYCD